MAAAERDRAPDEGRHGHGEARGPDWLERLATWISAALLAALLGFLAWDAAREHRPPAFRAEVEAPRVVGSRYHVPVVVHNEGDLAARTVEVSVAAPGDAGEEASFTIDWLPGRSKHRGVAIFRERPAGALRAEVTAYSEP